MSPFSIANYAYASLNILQSWTYEVGTVFFQNVFEVHNHYTRAKLLSNWKDFQVTRFPKFVGRINMYLCRLKFVLKRISRYISPRNLFIFSKQILQLLHFLMPKMVVQNAEENGQRLRGYILNCLCSCWASIF